MVQSFLTIASFMEVSTPLVILKPPFVSPLSAGRAFDRLTETEKLS
jgi:hypothetical protein